MLIASCTRYWLRSRNALVVDNDRFVDAITRLPDFPIIGAPQPRPPDLVVDLIRPADLVAMRVEVFGLELLAVDEPVLQAGPDGGHLIVHLSFQHIAERAIYESKVDPSIPDDAVPDPVAVENDGTALDSPQHLGHRRRDRHALRVVDPRAHLIGEKLARLRPKIRGSNFGCHDLSKAAFTKRQPRNGASGRGVPDHHGFTRSVPVWIDVGDFLCFKAPAVFEKR